MLSTPNQRFACAHLSRPYLTRLFPPFPQRSPPRLLTVAACGGLEPAPDSRLRGAYPHLLHSIAPPSVRSWHTVIRIPHEPVAATFKLAIQLVQHEIREQGGERAALRGPF